MKKYITLENIGLLLSIIALIVSIYGCNGNEDKDYLREGRNFKKYLINYADSINTESKKPINTAK